MTRSGPITDGGARSVIGRPPVMGSFAGEGLLALPCVVKLGMGGVFDPTGRCGAELAMPFPALSSELSCLRKFVNMPPRTSEQTLIYIRWGFAKRASCSAFQQNNDQEAVVPWLLVVLRPLAVLYNWNSMSGCFGHGDSPANQEVVGHKSCSEDSFVVCLAFKPHVYLSTSSTGVRASARNFWPWSTKTNGVLVVGICEMGGRLA